MSDARRSTEAPSDSRSSLDCHAIDEATLEAAKAAYEPSITSLSDLCRNPRDAPLAAVALLVVLATIGWQAVMAAMQYHPVVGVLVLATGALAYRVARAGWRIENDHVATELALRDLERGDAPPRE